jgi:hypothetical protein
MTPIVYNIVQGIRVQIFHYEHQESNENGYTYCVNHHSRAGVSEEAPFPPCYLALKGQHHNDAHPLMESTPHFKSLHSPVRIDRI